MPACPTMNSPTAKPLDADSWDKIAPPPRAVPISIRLRLMAAHFHFGSGFACVFGGIWFVVGFFLAVTAPQLGPRLIGATFAAIGAGIVLVALGVTASSSQKVVAMLRWGQQKTTDGPGERRVVLVDRRLPAPREVDLQRYPWLGVSEQGELQYCITKDSSDTGFAGSLGQALLVVLPTYVLAALGVRYGASPFFDAGAGEGLPPLLGALVVLLFTTTHGVFPVFFYAIFSRGIDVASGPHAKWNPGLWFVQGFTYLHMGGWFGIPILGLAAMTGWYSLVWLVIHIAFAGRGRRRWAFLEHGSTSMALLLFLVCFASESLFPMGILVVICQSLLLTLVEWKAKGLWTVDSNSA